MLRMIYRPWRHPGDDPEKDADWDEPLPEVIVLGPDYMAELPLWGERWGNIDWHFTKFSPELLVGSPTGSRNSMTTFTPGRPAGGPAACAGSGPLKPRNWPPRCAP